MQNAVAITIPQLNATEGTVPTALLERDKARYTARNSADSPAAYVAAMAELGQEATLNLGAAEIHNVTAEQRAGKGFKVEVFAFGKTALGLFWSNERSRYEVFTRKGTRLSQSSKTAAHAKQGARNELKRPKYNRGSKAA